MDWAGLAVVLGAVTLTIMLTVPWACRRCQCEEDDRANQTHDARRTRWQ